MDYNNGSVTVQNVNYYGGIDAEHAAAGRGHTPNSNISFINYYQGPPPTPAQATATRPARFLPDRRITTMEGFQGGSRGTMSFINCDMSGGWDDVLDLGSQVAQVIAQPAPNQIEVTYTPTGIYGVGDQIELGLRDTTGAVYEDSPNVTITNISQTKLPDGTDSAFVLTLSQKVTVQNTGINAAGNGGNATNDICTDLSSAGPITLTNSSFSSQFGRVFLKCGGAGTGITITGCLFHDMFGFNGLAVVGSRGYGQGPLEARNVTIQNNTFRNCQYPCVIKDGTAASGSNVRVLNNTFLDNSSDPNQGSDGPALVVGSVNGVTISGNTFERNWGANIACEYDQNLVITNNTFNHPNFIRPALATPYTGKPGSGDGFIIPDPSSVVFLSSDAGVSLSGNIVNSAGPFTKSLVEVNTAITGATGLANGIVQVDNPVAFCLASLTKGTS